VLLLDIASALVALVALSLVLIPNPEQAPTAGGAFSVFGDFVVGLRYVLDRPVFVFLSVFLALTVFGSAFVYALSGPLVLGLGNEATIGIVYAAYGTGAVVGALAVGAWGGPRRRMPGILIATVVVGVGTLVSGLRPDVIWIAATIAVVGGAQSVLMALNRVVFQEHAAPEVLGRVFAFRMVLTAAAQAAGIVLSGSLAARVFEPAMAPGGALEGVLGPLIGSGEGRGAAVLLILIGGLLAIGALASAASRRVRTMEQRLEA
jgi:MFS family permease